MVSGRERRLHNLKPHSFGDILQVNVYRNVTVTLDEVSSTMRLCPEYLADVGMQEVAAFLCACLPLADRSVCLSGRPRGLNDKCRSVSRFLARAAKAFSSQLVYTARYRHAMLRVTCLTTNLCQQPRLVFPTGSRVRDEINSSSVYLSY